VANPYAPPSARVADGVNTDAPPALWNPNAAANWCLIFTPAFGAFLNMLNWDALGEPERAAWSKRWFIVSLVMLGLYLVLSMLTLAARAEGMVRLIALIYLFVWYFAPARAQITYVRNEYGAEYPRRGWGRPLLIGVAAWIGYALIAGVIAVASHAGGPR